MKSKFKRNTEKKTNIFVEFEKNIDSIDYFLMIEDKFLKEYDKRNILNLDKFNREYFNPEDIED
jgi:ADP-dependent phosphofructokinase/glucokinase